MPKRNGVGKSSKKSSKAVVGYGVNGNLIPGAGGGTQPGAGRPKNRIRKEATESLGKRLKIADAIIDDDDAKDRDRIMGLAFLHKVSGMEQKGAVTVDAELLNEFFNVLELYVTDVTELADIREKWLDILADRVGAR